MKTLGWLLTACIALAALKVAFATLLVAFLVTLVWGCFFMPAQTFGFMGLCLVAGLANNHPWAFVAGFALITIMAALQKSA